MLLFNDSKIAGGIFYANPKKRQPARQLATIQKQKPLTTNKLEANIVRPKGLEPLSLVPETKILSIELRAHISGCKYTVLY
jgi:hypothetical protein